MIDADLILLRAFIGAAFAGNVRGFRHDSVIEALNRVERVPDALRLYADLDTWEHVASPDSNSAWVKMTGHPTPWVDAQGALS